jgi:tetratricopeptide (TPR) repeat protein
VGLTRVEFRNLARVYFCFLFSRRLQFGGSGKTSGAASTPGNRARPAAQRDQRSFGGAKGSGSNLGTAIARFANISRRLRPAATASKRLLSIARTRHLPDDDVAHYELGKVMVERGSYAEAEKEFEAALKINPDFVDAKKQLDTVRKVR